jgi:hypothetical protein
MFSINLVSFSVSKSVPFKHIREVATLKTWTLKGNRFDFWWVVGYPDRFISIFATRH